MDWRKTLFGYRDIYYEGFSALLVQNYTALNKCTKLCRQIRKAQNACAIYQGIKRYVPLPARHSSEVVPSSHASKTLHEHAALRAVPALLI